MRFLKKLSKYLAIFILALIVLVIVLILFTQTPMFKGWLKNKAVDLAQPYFNAQLSVAALGGDLFNTLVLDNVVLSRDDEAMIEIGRVVLNYDLLPLLSQEVLVKKFVLAEPKIDLRQSSDGQWNIATLLKSDTTETESEQSILDLQWTIQVPDAEIISGIIRINKVDTTQLDLPEVIKDIDLKFGLGYAPGQAKLSLAGLNFETESPNLKLETMHSDVRLTKNEFSARPFELKTDSTQIQSVLEVQETQPRAINFSLNARPLALSEIRRFFRDLKIYGDPHIDIDVNGTLADLNVRTELLIGAGRLSMNGNLDVENEPYRYNVMGRFSQIDLGELTRQPDLSSDLNFEFKLNGRNIEWGKIRSDFSITTDTCRAMGRYIYASKITGKIRGDSLLFRGNISELSANVNVAGKFVSRENRPAIYSLNGEVRDLNLASLADTAQVTTDLNFDYRLDGRGTDLENLAADFTLNFLPSTVDTMQIDSAYFDIAFKNKIINVKKFNLSAPFAHVTAEGNLGIKKEGNLRLNADFKDFSVLAKAMALDTLWGEGHLRAELSGTLDSLSAHADMDLTQVGFKDVKVQKLKGQINGEFSESKKIFAFDGMATDATAYGFEDVNADFKMSYEDTLLDYEIKLVQTEKMTTEMVGTLAILPEGYKLILAEFQFEGYEQNWTKIGQETEILYQGSEITVSKLKLASEGQTITLYGSLDTQGSGDLHFEIDSLNVQKFVNLMNTNAQYAGLLNFNLAVSGTFENPVIDGDFKIVDGQYFEVSFEKFSGKLGYQDNEITWKFMLSKTRGDSLMESSGFLPYKLSFSPFENQLLENEPLEIKLSTRGIDMSFMQGFMQSVKNIQGLLVADIVLRNTFQDLRGVGPIRFINGQFEIPDLGTKYEDINIVLVLEDKEIIINNFKAKSEGYLKIIEGSLSLSQQHIERFRARLRADNFELMDTKALETSVTGEITLSGSIQAPVITGDLSVPDARVYYPAWIEEETTVELTDQPFFVIGADTSEFDVEGALRFQKEGTPEVEKPFTETVLYKNLRTNLSLKFDRNAWLRSEEANIEVEGTLDLVKEQNRDFVIFGSLSTVRGFYELQGNRFEIVEGEINFRGSPDYNPNIHIEAVHEFRQRSQGEALKREIQVVITGTKDEPQFSFTMDGQPVEQKDVVSILLFGQPFDDLPIGQRSNVASESDGTSLEGKATGFLTGQLIKRLSSRLGSEFNLDVLQIESGQGLGDARVRVGKYVTPDVFVSVSQDFGAEGEQKVELEYEIPRKILFFNLFLQASKEREGDTAADVIWKIEW